MHGSIYNCIIMWAIINVIILIEKLAFYNFNTIQVYFHRNVSSKFTIF